MVLYIASPLIPVIYNLLMFSFVQALCIVLGFKGKKTKTKQEACTIVDGHKLQFNLLAIDLFLSLVFDTC